MCSLFDEVANIVSKELGFNYDKTEAEDSAMFLKNAKDLFKSGIDVL